jgi:DNA-binding beta-propeller fold protein YncE
MSPSRPHPSGHLALALSLALLGGCVAGRGHVGVTAVPGGEKRGGPGPAFLTAPAAMAPRTLLPVPGGSRAFVALSGGADFIGRVELARLAVPALGNSAAPFRLLTALPLARAIVTAGTLADDLYTRNGAVVTGTTGLDGAFSLPGGRPAAGPSVVSALLASGHQLSAIFPEGQASGTLDEATTLVTELARWQLAPDATALKPDVTDVASGTWTALVTATRELLGSSQDPLTLEVQDVAGAPRVPALQRGAGHVLRNAYVEHFGSRTTPSGTGQANTLSDRWLAVLGFRPLALTRVAGNGVRGYDLSEARPAVDVPLAGPRHVATDHLGNVWFTQFDNHLVSVVPRYAMTGPLLGANASTLAPGSIYNVVGVAGAIAGVVDWETQYVGAGGNPAVASGTPLYGPDRLVLERDGAGSHLYFTAPLTGRVMMVPHSTVSRFGATLQAGRLYTVAGRGLPPANTTGWPAVNGQLATQGGLWAPTGLARDAQGNVWLLDAGNGQPNTGELMVVRASDGRIFRVPLQQNGVRLHPDGARELVLSPAGTELYLADTARHCIFKVTRPADGTIAAYASVPPVPLEVERVLGKPGQPGFLDFTAPGATVPAIEDLSAGVAEPTGDLTTDGGPVASASVRVLLDSPTALTFDGLGRLLVGDTGTGRIRMLHAGAVYTLAGGLATRYVTGDARLAFLPGTSGLCWSPADGTVLVTDEREALVRRLHTQRGILE